MKMKHIIAASLCCVSVALAGCGGGGGGGGGSTGTTGVRVLHGAIDATPVELVTDTALTFQSARFGESSGYQSLGKGTHLLTLYSAKTRSDTLLTRSITNTGDQKFTVLLYGNRESLGLNTIVFTEDAPPVPDGAGVVRGIHAVGGAATVEFVIGTATAAANFGRASSYVDVAPGPQPFLVRRTADRLVVARGVLQVDEGRAYSIFASGEAGYLVTTPILEE